MALRSTYSSGLYDSGLYGVPETTQGAATSAASSSATANAVTIVAVSASTSATSASTSSGLRVADGSASASLATVTTSVALSYNEVDGFRNGYGLNTYGSYVYGRNHSIEEASATISASATPAVAYQVTRNVSSSISVTSSGTVAGYLSVVGSANSTLSLDPEIEYIRIRNVSGSAATDAEISINSRYKWIDIAEPTTPTWVAANYREGAA
jgi:hypothetical protein